MMTKDFARRMGWVLLGLSATLAGCGPKPAFARKDVPAGLGNPLVGGPNDVHALLLDETADVFRKGSGTGLSISDKPAGVGLDLKNVPKSPEGNRWTAVYTSREITTDFPCNEMVPSWNVEVPESTGFFVEFRFGFKGSRNWTSYYYLGRWGSAPTPEKKIIKDPYADIKGDCMISEYLFDRIQYRVHLSTTDLKRTPVLRRFAVAYSNTTGDAELAKRQHKDIDPGPKEKWARRLPVPFRSQKWESPALRGQVCSPTSTSMVMEYRGVKQPTATVAGVIYDPEYRQYGTWLRAVQGAFTFGVPGYIERFNDWNAVKRHIANGQPVITSIIVAPDAFQGASPYGSSDGHLIVVTGFDANGNVCVNDPGGASAEKGSVTYPREGMEQSWFGHGGVGYVLEPVEKTPSAAMSSASNR